VLRSLGEQWYRGMLVEARRRFADGFQAHLSYTLSKAENLSGVASFGGGAESAFSGGSVENQFDTHSSRGRAATDQRHRLVVDGVWNLPFGVLKDFRLSGIFVAESGKPYSASISASNLNFSTPDGTQYSGFSGGIYGQGGLSLLPTIERNSNAGAASYRVDLRLARDLHVTSRLVIEVLGEGFNIFNAHIWTQNQHPRHHAHRHERGNNLAHDARHPCPHHELRDAERGQWVPRRNERAALSGCSALSLLRSRHETRPSATRVSHLCDWSLR